MGPVRLADMLPGLLKPASRQLVPAEMLSATRHRLMVAQGDTEVDVVFAKSYKGRRACTGVCHVAEQEPA